MRVGGQSEVGRLLSVAVKPAGDACGSAAAVDRQWRDLGYTAPPELAAATSEYRTFLALLETAGADVLSLPPDDRVGLDSLYARDASIVCDAGGILCNMGKPQRRTELAAHEAAPREPRRSRSGAARGRGADWRSHHGRRPPRGRRRLLDRPAYAGGGSGVPNQRCGDQPAARPGGGVRGRGDRRGPAALARAGGRVSPHVDRESDRPRPVPRLRPATAGAVSRGPARTGHRAGGGACAGVRHAGLQRARDRAARGSHGSGEPRDPGPVGAGRRDGARVRGAGDLPQGGRRAYLFDAAAGTAGRMTPRRGRWPYIGTTPLLEARMTRTILAAVGLIGLAACGGGSHRTTKRKAGTTPRPETRTTQATAQKHKAAARRDTTTQRNPLTNR